MVPKTEITQILKTMASGDNTADADRLFDLIYDELNNIATAFMRSERADHTLQPTALVHEAYVKMFPDGERLSAQSRSHLFGTAARAMRQVLVDHARKHNAEKRGGGAKPLELDTAIVWRENRSPIDVIVLDEALEALEGRSARQHEVVMLRFFAGLKQGEIASHLGVSVSTVEKDWQAARAWLYAQLEDDNET